MTFQYTSRRGQTIAMWMSQESHQCHTQGQDPEGSFFHEVYKRDMEQFYGCQGPEKGRTGYDCLTGLGTFRVDAKSGNKHPVLCCVSVCLTVWDVREKPINHFNGEHCVVTRIKDPFTFIPESIPTVLWALFQGPSHVFKFHHLVNCTQHTHN